MRLNVKSSKQGHWLNKKNTKNSYVEMSNQLKATAPQKMKAFLYKSRIEIGEKAKGILKSADYAVKHPVETTRGVVGEYKQNWIDSKDYLKNQYQDAKRTYAESGKSDFFLKKEARILKIFSRNVLKGQTRHQIDMKLNPAAFQQDTEKRAAIYQVVRKTALIAGVVGLCAGITVAPALLPLATTVTIFAGKDKFQSDLTANVVDKVASTAGKVAHKDLNTREWGQKITDGVDNVIGKVDDVVQKGSDNLDVKAQQFNGVIAGRCNTVAVNRKNEKLVDYLDDARDENKLSEYQSEDKSVVAMAMQVQEDMVFDMAGEATPVKKGGYIGVSFDGEKRKAFITTQQTFESRFVLKVVNEATQQNEREKELVQEETQTK